MAFNRPRRNPPLLHVRCPECGVPMQEREGKRGGFYGCTRFPLCIGTKPKGGFEQDSYTKLLSAAYAKALSFMCGPKGVGINEATSWMLRKGLAREPSAEELTRGASKLHDSEIERAVDAACAYAQEHGADLDFLVLAHQERLEHVRSRLKFDTDPEMIRRMPKPEIHRRYDEGVLLQLEADITTNWDSAGRDCPRCGTWSELLRENKEQKQQDPLAGLFEVFKLVCWCCPRCGVFSKNKSTKELTFVMDGEDDDASDSS